MIRPELFELATPDGSLVLRDHRVEAGAGGGSHRCGGSGRFDPLLNPDNPSTTLQTRVKATWAVGKRIKISLVKA